MKGSREPLAYALDQVGGDERRNQEESPLFPSRRLGLDRRRVWRQGWLRFTVDHLHDRIPRVVLGIELDG